MGLIEAQEMVRRFHVKFGCTDGMGVGVPIVRDASLRISLMREELSETAAALVAGDVVQTADGLCDLIYVALGTAVACGIDLDPLFDEVHRSNMAKEGGQMRADGKILKPQGWQPPRIAELLKAQGWKP